VDASDEGAWSIMKASTIFRPKNNTLAMEPRCVSRCIPTTTEPYDIPSNISDEEYYKNVSFI